MNAKGGTLDQLAVGVDTLAVTGQSLNAASLPRLNRAVDDTARAARQVSRAVNAVNDNPQSLIFGHGPIAPGPGEAGFTAPAAQATSP
jgi:phospholipid/cholesterol/gamma-HCH transport system substrate-binding protein